MISHHRHLSYLIRGTVDKDKEKAFVTVEQEWEAIPALVCRDLVESMPRRVAAAIPAKGGCTKH